jgi:hypothetical protein
VLIRAKKKFIQKFNMGIKNAEFHTDFKSIEKVLKKAQKMLIEICTIFTFTHVLQACLAYSFFLVHY